MLHNDTTSYVNNPIRIEYDYQSGRRMVTFVEESKAIAFYKKMHRGKRHPRIIPFREFDSMEYEIPAETALEVHAVAPEHLKEEMMKKKNNQKGVKRHRDVGWTILKVYAYKTLKSLGAVGIHNAVTSTQVVDRAKELGYTLSFKRVRQYCYHGVCSGYTGVSQVEGVDGYVYYLTKKGAALDYDEELTRSQR